MATTLAYSSRMLGILALLFSFQLVQAQAVATPTLTPFDEILPSNEDPVAIELMCYTPGATFSYTLDGSTPSPTHGLQGAAPTLTVTLGTNPQTTTVKVMAFKDGMTNSAVAQEVYTIAPRANKPLLSLTGSAQEKTILYWSEYSSVPYSYTMDGSIPTRTNGMLKRTRVSVPGEWDVILGLISPHGQICTMVVFPPNLAPSEPATISLPDF